MDNYNPKNYKKYTMLLVIVTVAALVVCAATFALKQNSAVAVQGNPYKNYSSYYNPKASSSQESVVSAESTVDEHYLITIYDGKIGVFKNGEATPFLTADTEVYLLPDADVKLLRKGIRAESFSEVKTILEDYE